MGGDETILSRSSPYFLQFFFALKGVAEHQIIMKYGKNIDKHVQKALDWNSPN